MIKQNLTISSTSWAESEFGMVGFDDKQFKYRKNAIYLVTLSQPT
jgi:hypothetical protein